MLSAVFIVGKLGTFVDEYRYVLVEKVPEPDTFSKEEASKFDRIKVKMWSNTHGVLEHLPEGKMVTIKGRLEEKNGEVFVVAELLRSE